VTYGEALQDFSSAKDYIYKTAYELASLLLPNYSLKKIYAIYRDRLLETMMNTAGDKLQGQCRPLLGFANLISSEFADAQADLLKKESLQDRVRSLSRELKIAKRIQTHLLPKVIPTVAGYDFAGRLIPAEEIGGDYWSIKHYKDDNRITIKLADITGHGVAAATLVAAVKFISGGYYQGAKSAAEVMKKTNRVLALETPHDILVTMVYGWLEPDTGEIRLVNAGHSPAFICNESLCIDIPQTGPVMGISEVGEYDEWAYKLSKNDIVFLGSDGITEAGTLHPFGVGRLKKVVTDSVNQSADEIADNVVKAVTEYVPDPHDDISMVVIKMTSEAA
jgi:sigma-B regulation protein RsbU (phosphoserine phosphatase)